MAVIKKYLACFCNRMRDTQPRLEKEFCSLFRSRVAFPGKAICCIIVIGIRIVVKNNIRIEDKLIQTIVFKFKPHTKIGYQSFKFHLVLNIC